MANELNSWDSWKTFVQPHRKKYLTRLLITEQSIKKFAHLIEKKMQLPCWTWPRARETYRGLSPRWASSQTPRSWGHRPRPCPPPGSTCPPPPPTICLLKPDFELKSHGNQNLNQSHSGFGIKIFANILFWYEPARYIFPKKPFKYFE